MPVLQWICFLFPNTIMSLTPYPAVHIYGSDRHLFSFAPALVQYFGNLMTCNGKLLNYSCTHSHTHTLLVSLMDSWKWTGICYVKLYVLELPTTSMNGNINCRNSWYRSMHIMCSIYEYYEEAKYQQCQYVEHSSTIKWGQSANISGTNQTKITEMEKQNRPHLSE